MELELDECDELELDDVVELELELCEELELDDELEEPPLELNELELPVPMLLRGPSSVACMRATWPAVNITMVSSST